MPWTSSSPASRWRSTVRRIFGSAWPNSISWWNFSTLRCRLPVLVVAILLAAPGIHAGCLQVAVFLQADPDIVVGRGQAERCDALAVIGVTKQGAVRQLVAKALAASMPADARFAVAYIDKTEVRNRHLTHLTSLVHAFNHWRSG